MKIAPSLNTTVIEPTKKALNVLVQQLHTTYQNLSQAVNGQISYGDGTTTDNIDGSWASVTTPNPAGTSFTVTHGLFRIPVGVHVTQKNVFCDVLIVSSTKTTITLQASAALAVLKLFIFLMLLSLVPFKSEAQGIAYHDIAIKTITPSGSSGVSGPLLQPIAGATVTVCIGAVVPVAGSVCSPANASLFSCIALNASCVVSNPMNADNNGNFQFFLASSSTYVVSVSGVGLTPYSYVLNTPCSVGSTCVSPTSNINFTGLNTFANTTLFNGQIQCKDVEGVKCVDSSNNQAWGGIDVGGWINAAYTALPATGGEIDVYNLTATCMNYATPILLNTAGKYATVIFRNGSTNQNNAGGACMNYTPTTATNAITIDWTPTLGGNFVPGAGIQNLTLLNNGCITAAGCGSLATGINIGPVNGGAEFGSFVNLSVSGFSTGVSNSSNISYSMIFTNFVAKFNSIGFAILGAGDNIEELHFIGGMFAENATGFTSAGPTQADFVGTAFDSNTVVGMNGNSSGYYNLFNPHFENNPNTTANYITMGNSDVVNIYGGIAKDDVAVGTIGFWFSGGTFLVKDLVLFSAGRTVTTFVFIIATSSDIGVYIQSPSVLTLASLGAPQTGNGRWAVNSSNSGTIPPTSGTSGQHTISGNLTLGSHLNQVNSNQFSGTSACVANTKAITWSAGAFNNIPNVIVFDYTTKGGINLTAGPSTTGFTVSCTGATDAFSWMAIGQPN